MRGLIAAKFTSHSGILRVYLHKHSIHFFGGTGHILGDTNTDDMTDENTFSLLSFTAQYPLCLLGFRYCCHCEEGVLRLKIDSKPLVGLTQ